MYSTLPSRMLPLRSGAVEENTAAALKVRKSRRSFFLPALPLVGGLGNSNLKHRVFYAAPAVSAETLGGKDVSGCLLGHSLNKFIFGKRGVRLLLGCYSFFFRSRGDRVSSGDFPA
jgi:hypothetical protein